MESALISDERLSDIRVPFAPVVATAGYAHALNRQAGVGKASEGKVCRTSTKMLAQSHQRLPKHIIIYNARIVHLTQLKTFKIIRIAHPGK